MASAVPVPGPQSTPSHTASDLNHVVVFSSRMKEIPMLRKTLLKASLALVLLLGGLAFVAYPRTRIAAAPAPVTYGDIQAILHAGFTGGQDAILVHAHQAMGTPVEDYSRDDRFLYA